MSMFSSPYDETAYKVESVFYSPYDKDIPQLTPEFELVVNSNMTFLAIDNKETLLKA